MNKPIATYKDDDGTHWNCSNCNKRHSFTAYVAAHWRERLLHTCDCGARHAVQLGRVFKVTGKAK